MSLSFFKGLNPFSVESGVYGECHGEKIEIFDISISENILDAFELKQDFLGALFCTFNIIHGKHYTILAHAKRDFYGRKGLLDLLLFPLVSRKLLFTDFPPVIKTIALLIAIPLEIARFSLAVGLTLVLAPLVAIVNFAKNSYCYENEPMDPREPEIMSLICDDERLLPLFPFF